MKINKLFIGMITLPLLFGAVSCKNNVDDGVEIGLDQFASSSSKYYSLTATIDTNDPSKDGYKNKTFSATGHLWVSKFAGKEVYYLGFDEGNNGNWCNSSSSLCKGYN